MDSVDPIRILLSLAFVLSLIVALAFLAKRYGLTQLVTKTQTGGRLRVIEVKYIDAKCKLVLVARDDTEHLLLIGDGASTVVEERIKG